MSAKALVFFITFLGPLSVHTAREAWSMVKPEVHEDLDFSPSFLGIIDFCFLISYAAGLYFAGYLGDSVPLKLVLFFGMLIASIAISLVGLLGLSFEHHVIAYIVLFAFNGLG